jgi:hypothetical protein
MKYLKLTLALLFASCLMCKAQTDYGKQLDYKRINALTMRESKMPIRAGEPGKAPFWNTYSKRFTFAPAFEVSPINGASRYEYTVTASDSTRYRFTADKPYRSLSPIWAKIPAGSATLTIKALDGEGKEMRTLLVRKFQRSAVFHGPYQPAAATYTESARRALDYLYRKPYMQAWATKGIPDTLGYHLYCYPAKIISAVTRLMLSYGDLVPQHREQAMTIAVKAADYLLRISEPEGAPLAFFPPTYAGEGDKRDTSPKRFHNQFMMIYPAEAAGAYLDLYDVTHDRRYWQAALRIAATYAKLQESSGTWKLRIWNTGKPVTAVDCIPTVIIRFLDRLHLQYGITQYLAMRDRAYQWLMANPMKTFNWSGQFEDQNPLLPYQDLTKDDAVNVAIILFQEGKADKRKLSMAEELMRYSEDQFMVWGAGNTTWPTPSALEQYFCYLPINASAACMIEGYMAAYHATNKSEYLAKALALANSVTTTQHADGRYPTFWSTDRQSWDADEMDWLNCTANTVTMMLEMEKAFK